MGGGTGRHADCGNRNRISLALRDRSPIGPAFAFLIDAAFVTLAAWRSDIASVAGVSFAATWFAPVVLVMLLHLLPRALPEGRWTWWLQDRLLAGLVCAAVSVLLPSTWRFAGRSSSCWAGRS
jgi:hypothetical protein